MKPKVYLETSVVSYLTSPPSRDIVVAARQQLTRDWWDKSREACDLYVSELVVDEASAGDHSAAERRLAAVEGIELLAVTAEARRLAGRLVADGVVPRRALEDALHIAAAIVHGMDFLLTWNCTHIANARLRARIEEMAADHGYGCPVICTPEQLMEPE
jgi:predicted nucleic acid-binding protein